jgi:hypothetical protein
LFQCVRVRAVRVLQNRKRHSQIFSRAEVFLEVQRLAGAWQVVELAVRDRLTKTVLGDAAEWRERIAASLAGAGSARLSAPCADLCTVPMARTVLYRR